MFNGWDADVIVKSIRYAVRWNGIWHYKQICKTTTLESIQKRDALKEAAIKNHGYNLFIVKDMGKFNKEFVEEQFEIFKLYLIDFEPEKGFMYDGEWIVDDLEE
tara:strand:- start:365 stop:676 length:312 start_codon:yes stop_codon:yes gene_type:complete